MDILNAIQKRDRLNENAGTGMRPTEDKQLKIDGTLGMPLSKNDGQYNILLRLSVALGALTSFCAKLKI